MIFSTFWRAGRRKCRISAKILNFVENLEFRGKSRISKFRFSAKILSSKIWMLIFGEKLDFRRNFRFSSKSEIFVKIRDFRRNSKFSSKFEFFVQIRNFRRNSKFSSKFKIFAKIQDFRQNSTFLQKFEIFDEIRNFR